MALHEREVMSVWRIDAASPVCHAAYSRRKGDVASYGFKLIEIQLFRGRARTALEFGAPDGPGKPSYLDLLVEDVRAESAPAVSSSPGQLDDAGPGQVDQADGEVELVDVHSDDIVAEDVDEQVPVGEGHRQLAVVRLKGAKRLQGALLLDTVYGIVGDHSLAVDPLGRKADTDLHDLATTRHYRALIIAPSHGKNGLLAVEVIARSHAGARLGSRLFAAAQGRHSFKIRTFGAVADDEAIRDLMNGARIPEVRLFQTVASEDSATPRTMRATLTFSIGKGSPEETSLRKRVAPWLPTRANKAKDKKPNPAAEANSLASWLWPAVAKDVEFETAEVIVQGRNRSKRLKPLDMTEGFTYDLGDVRPDDDTFIAQVADVVNSLAATNQVDLDPDWSSPVDES